MRGTFLLSPPSVFSLCEKQIWPRGRRWVTFRMCGIIYAPRNPKIQGGWASWWVLESAFYVSEVLSADVSGGLNVARRVLLTWKVAIP